MPELPEVETIRRQLDPLLQDRLVAETSAFPHPKFTPAHDVAGGVLRGVRRRGKYLLVDVERDDAPHDLIVHLGMTGSLRVVGDGDDARDPYERARWRFEDGEALVFRDVRRFGRILVTAAGVWDPASTLGALGPEPWDPALDDGGFWQRTRTSSRHIKTQLLGQRLVAGVGNIYADEALWLAGIHPQRRSITRRQGDALLAAVRTVLEDGIRHGGTTLRDYVDADGRAGGNQHHLHAYGRDGEPCDRCGNPMRRTLVDARSTTYCTTCQPRR